MTIHSDDIIKKTIVFVKEKLAAAEPGHDWSHVQRVWQTARFLAQEEKADLFVVELAALLHDVADYKFCGGDCSTGARVARTFLEQCNVSKELIDHVCCIVENISFKGAAAKNCIDTLEGKVVQDADRLDALGAIGIARTFAYAGYKGHRLHDPECLPQLHQTFDEYKKGGGTAINHFYEKLLLLKDRMHTPTARKIAERRQAFMELYLQQFLAEWDSQDVA